MMQLKHHFHKELDKIQKKSAEQIEQIEKSFISKAGKLINRHAYNWNSKSTNFFIERDNEIKSILDHVNLEKESLTNDYERQKQSIAKKYEK